MRSTMLIAVVILATVACTGASPSGEQAPGGAMQPKRGGFFHLPQVQPNANLDPYLNGIGGTMGPLIGTMYETLIARDATPHVNWSGDPRVKPWLAERWERLDNNTYVFHLRKDVKWQDGEPFTTDDVLWSITQLKERKGAIDAPRTANIKSVEALDADRVRIVTINPNPDFLQDDLTQVVMGPKHLADQGKSLETNAVGTGAFKIKSLDKTSGWTVTRNDGYWATDPANNGERLPYLDGVTGHYLSDRGTMTAAMAIGQLDAMTVADKPLVDSAVATNSDLVFDKVYIGRGWSIIFAVDRPPFDDIRVRRAMNLALDRQDMVTKAAMGDGVPNPPFASGWTRMAIPAEELSKVPGFNPSTREQDLAQAKRLLAEAGNPKISAKLSYPEANTNDPPIATVAANQFNDLLGMSIALQPLDTPSMNKSILDGTFEFRTASLARGRSSLFEYLHSKSPTNKRGPYDPELDALLDRYLAEFDDARAADVYRQIQRMLNDKAYVLGTVSRAQFTVYQPWLHNLLDNFGGQVVPWYTPPALWIDVDMLPPGRRDEKP